MNTETFDERIAREKMERKAWNDKLLLVAKCLKMEVMESDNEFSANVTCGKAGETSIHLQTGAYHCKDKIHVSGKYPGEYQKVYKDNKEVPFPSINVGRDKSPEVIASDIMRRFMPSYLERLELVKERNKVNQEYKDKTKTALERLNGGFVCNEDLNRNKLYLGRGYNYSGTASVYGDDVHLDLRSLSVETAVKILEIVNKLEAKSK